MFVHFSILSCYISLLFITGLLVWYRSGAAVFPAKQSCRPQSDTNHLHGPLENASSAAAGWAHVQQFAKTGSRSYIRSRFGNDYFVTTTATDWANHRPNHSRSVGPTHSPDAHRHCDGWAGTQCEALALARALLTAK